VTEDEAKAAVDVPHGTMERIEAFVAFLRQENEAQNLVSRGSLAAVWERHVLDSAQLLRFAPSDLRNWVDLGSGAGFPGLIVAALAPAHFTLIEARRLRVDFLRRGAEILRVEERVDVVHAKVEAVPPRHFDVISARAFAPLAKLLQLGSALSTPETVWILPKGRNAKSELDAARASWQGDFRIEPSLTDADAGIIVARGVEAKRKKGR
jgi:16S rRNA (guanine527-N7)-methyltransferase